MRLVINSLFEEKQECYCGKRYERSEGSGKRYSRWGYNPGSVRIGDEKVRVEVPRIMDNEKGINVEFEAYKEMKKLPAPDEQFLSKLILGISQNDYERVSKHCAESIGLSQPSVSRRFIEISSKALKEFSNRDLSGKDIVAIIIDGKALYREQIIVCVGITSEGDKMVLDFIQSATENSRSIKQMLKRLLSRGMRYTEGILCISDGSKGIRKAIDEVFGRYRLHQRCQWHKRENIISYLKEDQQDEYKRRIQRAYNEDDYETAKSQLTEIGDELKNINISASRSLMEGLEETLTIHKLGLADKLRHSLCTTNIIESINSMTSRHLMRVTRWHNSDQLFRWVAVTMLEIEKRLNKIRNHKSLTKLRDKMKIALKIKTQKSKSLKAA
jgi:transposase-like protein